MSTNGQNDVGLTTIKITDSTRDKLKDLGKKSESYDTIILRLIEGEEGRDQDLEKFKWDRHSLLQDLGDTPIEKLPRDQLIKHLKDAKSVLMEIR